MATAMQLSCFLLAITLGATQEPAPEMYTTMMMEPEPSSESSSAMPSTSATTGSVTTPSPSTTTTVASNMSGNATTAAPVTYEHTVSLTVTLTNTTGMTEAELIQKLTGAMPSGGGSVAVTISVINVKTTMSGLPYPCNKPDKTKAFANMCNVSQNATTLTCTASAGGRRLQTGTGTGEFNVAVANSGDADVVSASNAVEGKITTTSFTSALKDVDPTQYASLDASSLTAATTKAVEVTSVITSQTATAPTTADIETGIQTGIAGAAVSGISVTTTSYEASTTTAAATTTDFDSSASLASVMTVWAIACGFLMN